MFDRLKHMLIKEFIQIFRDPRMKIIIFLPPVFQMIIFGYAVSTDVRNVSTAVYDLDNSTASREIVAHFERSGYFSVDARVSDERTLSYVLDRGDAEIVIKLNKGFEHELNGGRTAHLQVIADGTDSNTARLALNYSEEITAQYAREVLASRISRMSGPLDVLTGVDLEVRAWFNENLESRNFYVPGVISLLVMVVTVMLTSMAVVREREIGTMEQMLVTPIRPGEFILGKTIPFACIGFLDVILISTVAVFWFEVPIRGNPFLLLFSAGLYLMTTLGIGLFISTISQTQQQAIMTAFFFILPASLLSGFVFPVFNMPEAVQWITLFNPMRHFLVIIRGIFLKGVGADVLWPQMAALFTLGVLTLAITIRRFKKTLI